MDETGYLSARRLNYLVYLSLIIITLLAVWQLRAYDKGCLLGHDCESYIAMVEDIAYKPMGMEHHQMRFLPPLLVSFLVKFTLLSIHEAFLILSTLAFAIASILSYRYCRSEKLDIIPSVVIALLLMTWHWGMLIPLKTPYQACDAMFYPFCLLMLMSTQQERVLSTLGWGILAMFCRQSGFVFGFFALGWLFYKNPKKWMYGAAFFVLIASYFSLSAYYHAGGAFTRVLLPDASLFQLTFIKTFLVESGIFTVLLPFLPFLLILDYQVFDLEEQI